MKFLLHLTVFVAAVTVKAQNVQLHYDFRHSLDPSHNSKNFPSLTFEYFKNIDTVGTGSFLFKMQADLKGTGNNVAQVFTQISQNIRFWKPKIYLSVGYSGGLGVTSTNYGFYISNSLSIGASYPFQWKGAFLSVNLLYRYNAFDSPSYDPQFTFYFGKGLNNYRYWIAGSFVFWTENRNQGNDVTKDLRGKKFSFFGDPQIWVRIKGNLSAGTRINVFYHTITDDDTIQIYPTLGIKYQF